MAINISKTDLADEYNFNISSDFQELHNIKINGKFINKIWWNDPTLFSTELDNCGLIYRHHKDIQYSIISGHAYDILTNTELNDVNLTYTRINTRSPKTYTTISYPKGFAEQADEIDNGYYLISDIIGNSTYKLTAKRHNYATYNTPSINITGSGTVTEYNVYLNPVDNSLGRVILNWNDLPSNLDLYIINPNGTQLSVNSASSTYGYVNKTSNGNNITKQEIFTLTKYVDLTTPLRTGGDFDIWVKYNSNDGSAMSSNLQIFTQQFGVKNIDNDTDDIARYNQFWHAGTLNIKSGLADIPLTGTNLITYTKPLNISTLETLKCSVSTYKHSYYDEYIDGVIKTLSEENQLILRYNGILNLLKDYPFVVELSGTNKTLYSNVVYNISDNLSTGTFSETAGYNVYYNFTGFSETSGTVNVNFYLNEELKEKNCVYYQTTLNIQNSAATLDITNIFANKNIPIALYKDGNPLQELEYVYNTSNKGYYTIKKHWKKNEYFSFKDILANSEIKFTLGINATIPIKSLKSTNDYIAPSTFTTITPYIYHNNTDLNGFTVDRSVASCLMIYGSLNGYKQRYFDPYWISNNNYYYYQGDQNYKENKFDDLYCNSEYEYISQNQFYNYENYITYLSNTDTYSLKFLDYSNVISGKVLLSSNFIEEYLSTKIDYCTATANNRYFYYSELSPIQDPYILTEISSMTQGKFGFSYSWDANGLQVSFSDAAPTGETCILLFKRIKNVINRSEISGYSYLPHLYVTSDNTEISNLYNWSDNNVTIDYFKEMSGYNTLNIDFIDYDRMYSLGTSVIDTYTCNLNLILNITKNNRIKQAIGFQCLLWKQENNSWKIVYSNEWMTNSNINVTIPQLVYKGTYKIELYSLYAQYKGQLSGIYNSDFSEYQSRWNESYYNQYTNNEKIYEKHLIKSEVISLTENNNTYSLDYTLPYGQIQGQIYSAASALLSNDFNGKIILTNTENNLIYHGVWSGSNYWFIDYIYPGTYNCKIYYGGETINDTDMTITAGISTIDITTTLTFKSLTVNLYNTQTGNLAASCPPTGENISFSDYDDYEYYSYRLKVYGRNDLISENVSSNLTREIYNSYSGSHDNRNISNQLYKSLYKFSLAYNDKYPINIVNVEQNEQNLNITYPSTALSTFILNSEELDTSGTLVKLWTDKYYWKEFSMQLNTNFRFNGLSASMYNKETSSAISNLYTYYGSEYYYNYTYETMQKALQYSLSNEDDYQYYYSDYNYYYCYADSNAYTTGDYVIESIKHFNNPNNKNIKFSSSTVGIYDNEYHLTFTPSGYPTKKINIKPLMIKENISGDISGYLADNTLVSLTMFCGNSENIIDYEFATGVAIHNNLSVYPDWYDWWYYLGGENREANNLCIIPSANYWIGLFNIYPALSDQNNLTPLGLYPIDNTLVCSDFISKSASSIATVENYSTYTGLHIPETSLSTGMTYILLFSLNQINVKGYLRDCNDQSWDNWTFTIKVYDNETSALVKEFTNISNQQFDIGTLNKGTYRTEIYMTGETENIILDEDAVQTWSANTANQRLFRTKLARSYITGTTYYTNRGSNQSLPQSKMNIEFENMSETDERLKLKYSKYGTNRTSYNYGQYISGVYNLKGLYILDETTANVDVLNINTSLSTFTISQETLKSYISGSYKQQSDPLYIGTIIDSNENIVFFDSTNDGTNLTGTFRTSNFTNITDGFTLRIGEMPVSAANIQAYNGTLTRDTYIDHAWIWNLSYINFTNLPNTNNLTIYLKSSDNLFSTSGTGTSIGYRAWFKTGTEMNAKLYHDNTLLLGDTTQTLWNNDFGTNVSYSHDTGTVTIAFIDDLLNQPAITNYYRWYTETQYLKAYCKSCTSATTDAEIDAANIVYKSVYSIKSPSATIDGLYTDMDYLLKYRMGYDGQFSGYVTAENLTTSGQTFNVHLPYSNIYLHKYFKDRTTNNSINSSYAKLILQRCENDGYDKTYEYNGANEEYIGGLRTGKYFITLESHLPDTPVTYYKYEVANLLSSAVSLTNYINTTPVTVNIYLQNSDGSSYLSTDRYIRVFQNGLTYAYKQNLDTTTGRIQLTLFNVPFVLQVEDNNGNIQTITSITDKNNNSVTITNNTFNCDTSLESVTFYVKLQ